MANQPIVMGKTYKDRITGFKGVCTGYCQYITGCSQALLSPACREDGTVVDSRWFDEQRLEDCGVKAIEIDNGSTPGCDMPAPIR